MCAMDSAKMTNVMQFNTHLRTTDWHLNELDSGVGTNLTGNMRNLSLKCTKTRLYLDLSRYAPEIFAFLVPLDRGGMVSYKLCKTAVHSSVHDV